MSACSPRVNREPRYRTFNFERSRKRRLIKGAKLQMRCEREYECKRANDKARILYNCYTIIINYYTISMRVNSKYAFSNIMNKL